MRFAGRCLCERRGGGRSMHPYGLVYNVLALTPAHDKGCSLGASSPGEPTRLVRPDGVYTGVRPCGEWLMDSTGTH